MEPLLDLFLFIVTTKQTLFDDAVVEQLKKYNLTTGPRTRCTINLILSSYWTKN